MDKALAKKIREGFNDHLRYKLVQIRSQKKLQILAGTTAPSKTSVVNIVQSRGWTDHAKIVGRKLNLRNQSQKTEGPRATFRLIPRLLIHTVEGTTLFVTSQHWPFLQICEKIVFDTDISGRGVIATASISKHEVRNVVLLKHAI